MRPIALTASAWTSAGNASPRLDGGRSPVALPDRVRAVAATGWDAMGIGAADLRAADLDALTALLAEQSVAVGELELLVGWWDGPPPAAALEPLATAAGRVGCHVVKAGLEVPHAARDATALTRRLRDLGTAADALGVRVALEPMAHPGSLGLRDAVALLDRADRASLGLCLDAWHVLRSGIDPRDLGSSIDGAPLFVVELGDAAVPFSDDLSADSIDRRALPGTGGLDVRGFVAATRALGYEGRWSVEVLSAEHRALAVPAALERARAAALDVLR